MAGGRPFAKGDDPRRNTKGRPKAFDALRRLALQLSHEEVLEDGKEGEPAKPLIIDEHTVTRIEYILRQWAESKEPALQKAFVEIAFGKVPDKVEVSGKNGGKIGITVNDNREKLQRRLARLAEAVAAATVPGESESE